MSQITAVNVFIIKQQKFIIVKIKTYDYEKTICICVGSNVQYCRIC